MGFEWNDQPFGGTKEDYGIGNEIDEVEIPLPKESLGVTFGGCPAKVEALEPQSPLLKHGIFVGMLVDTITFTNSMNRKKSHHEMDTTVLVDLLNDYKASKYGGECMIRFVAPHYTLTPPPIPSCLEDVTEHDDVSDIIDEEVTYTDFIDDDSYSSINAQTEEVIDTIPDKISLVPDSPTESTTDSSVEYDDGYDDSDASVYELPSSSNGKLTKQYRSNEVYETYVTPKSSKKTSRPASSTKGKTSSTSARLASSSKNKNVNNTTSRPSKNKKNEKESSSGGKQKLSRTTSRPSKDGAEKASSSKNKKTTSLRRTSSKSDLDKRLEAMKKKFSHKRCESPLKPRETLTLKKKSSSSKNSSKEKNRQSFVTHKGQKNSLWA